MSEIECFHCRHKWPVGDTTTNRCPNCEWIVEIYFDQAEAQRVADTYNTNRPGSMDAAGFLPLIQMNGFAVSFPEQGRLSEIADRLVARPKK